MVKFIKSNFSWLKDVTLILFMICMVLLNARYATNDRVNLIAKENDNAHATLLTSFTSLDKTISLLQQNQSILIDNEKIISSHTIRLAELEIRVKLLESIHPPTISK
jgi:hypothetical protein